MRDITFSIKWLFSMAGSWLGTWSKSSSAADKLSAVSFLHRSKWLQRSTLIMRSARFTRIHTVKKSDWKEGFHVSGPGQADRRKILRLEYRSDIVRPSTELPCQCYRSGHRSWLHVFIWLVRFVFTGQRHQLDWIHFLATGLPTVCRQRLLFTMTPAMSGLSFFGTVARTSQTCAVYSSRRQ